MSQSTIKMDKGYYQNLTFVVLLDKELSQSTIKMDKGYYQLVQFKNSKVKNIVAIHNKNGQGLLLE